MKKWMKYVGMMAMCICCVFLLKSTAVQAAMADEAEDYELGETYNGAVTGSTFYRDYRYYKFYVSEKSHVTLNVDVSSERMEFNIYNSVGKIVLDNRDLKLMMNEVTGKGKGEQYRTLPKGTYYLEIGGYDTEFSFNIQAEKQIKLTKGTFSSLKSNKKGQMTVKCKPATNAIGYRIQYSTDYRFKKGVKTIYSPTATYTVKNMKKGQRYYVKVCPFTVYDDGTYVFGQNSYVKAVVVKKK